MPPSDLSLTNCPPAFRPFLIVWSQVVPSIQALPPEHQHDLARVICGFEPISSPVNPRINGIAADLRAVAIEISMRRTFQESYVNDLQAALDSGVPRTPGGRRMQASFVPPPSYQDASPASSVPPSPQPSTTLLSPHSPPASSQTLPVPPSRGHSRTPSASSVASATSAVSAASSARSGSSRTGAFSPTILADDVPGIEFIRETLYAALAEVLERKPHLRGLLRRDPSRAYFSAVALAIADVAASSATQHSASPFADIPIGSPTSPRAQRDPAEPVLRGVLGQTLALHDCPAPLRPFMQELCALGVALHAMEDEDSAATVRALQRGAEPPVPRLERVYEILERGVGFARRAEDVDGRARDEPAELRRRRTSTEGRAVAFANRINGLALGMTKLRAFRDRQEMVFKVLAGVGS